MHRHFWTFFFLAFLGGLERASAQTSVEVPAPAPAPSSATEQSQPIPAPQATSGSSSPTPSHDLGPVAPAAPVQNFEPAEVGQTPGAATALDVEGAAGTRDHVLSMDEMGTGSGKPRVNLTIFGDTAFEINSKEPKKPGFVMGTFDLLFFGEFQNLVASAEMGFDTAPDGSLVTDLERLFVRWRTERLVIDAGRTHTELGYWNNAFHHGRWLQTSVDRPRALRFEDDGGILPIHSVGVTARWHVIPGQEQLDLVAAVSNGRGDIVDDVRVLGDTNLFKAVLLKIETKGFGARDLRVGISGSYDRIAPLPAGGLPAAPDVKTRPSLPDVAINETILGAYIAYRGPSFTLLTEGFDLIHFASGQSWNTLSAFALLSYRLGAVIPYVMEEIRSGDIMTDPFFVPDPTVPSGLLGKFTETTVGLRCEISTWSAIKIEYRATLTDNEADKVHRGIVDWTFGI
jgi:hypothetical protein